MIKKFPEKKEEIIKLKKDLNIYYEKRNEIDDIMKTYNNETIYSLNKIKKLCESYQYNYFIMKDMEYYTSKIIEKYPKNNLAKDIYEIYFK